MKMKIHKIPVYELRLIPSRKPLRLAETEATYPAQAVRAMHELIGRTDREHMACLFLDGRLQIAGAHIIAIGGLRTIGTIDPSCVFRAALVAQAHGIVLGHNHPSGSPTPSGEDVATTEKLVDVGRLLGVHILDHLIVTARPDVFVSMRDVGQPSGAWHSSGKEAA